MNKFTELTLNDLAEITSSKRIYLSDYVESGIPFFRSKEIIERFNNQETSVELYISEKKFEEIKSRFGAPTEGDILITSVGTLGIPYLVRKDDVFYFKDGNLLWFRNFKADISSKFLFLWLCSELGKKSLLSYSIGSSQPAFTIENTKKVKISLPPIKTQKKIAAVLSAYDDLIENNKRRIALLEKMAEEIYREWFVRMRFPGYKETKFEKGVPVGWEIKPIDEIASETRKGIKKKNLTSELKYLGLEHIPRKSISITDFATADSVQSDKLLFQERDILFGKIRPYLHKISIANFSGSCSSDTIVIRPKQLKYEGFLLFTIFSESFVELATISSKGTKMPRADWDFLKQLELKIPSDALLEMFQSKFNDVFLQTSNLIKQNRILAESRNMLLSRLISGKLSVENLDIKFPPGMREDEEKAETIKA